MKRRTFIQTSIAAAAASAVFKPFYIKAQGKKYVFGFSQCTITEPWRVQFNKAMKKEADKYPEVELIITDGQDKTEKQVADTESLIRQGVDVLLISPKESAGLTGVVLEAIDKNIPAPILTFSLLARFASRQESSFSAKVIAALRNEFGGHAVKRE